MYTEMVQILTSLIPQQFQGNAAARWCLGNQNSALKSVQATSSTRTTTQTVLPNGNWNPFRRRQRTKWQELEFSETWRAIDVCATPEDFDQLIATNPKAVAEIKHMGFDCMYSSQHKIDHMRFLLAQYMEARVECLEANRVTPIRLHHLAQQHVQRMLDALRPMAEANPIPEEELHRPLT